LCLKKTPLYEDVGGGGGEKKGKGGTNIKMIKKGGEGAN